MHLILLETNFPLQNDMHSMAVGVGLKIKRKHIYTIVIVYYITCDSFATIQNLGRKKFWQINIDSPQYSCPILAN